VQGLHRGDVHGGRKNIVGRLGLIDIIIGVNYGFVPEFAAVQLQGAVGDHFIDVHIGLCAAAGLPNHQGEMRVEFAVDDFLGGQDNQIGFFEVQQAQRFIGQGRGFFYQGQSADDFPGHGFAADSEILQ